MRPDHRTGTTSLVMHFLKVRGVDASASWWGKLRSHIVKGLAVVKEICANYHKDGWVFLQSYLKRFYRIKSLLSKSSKVTVDGDCSHEVKRCLLLGRKPMTKLTVY